MRPIFTQVPVERRVDELVARQDSTFPWQGPAWVGEHMPKAQTVFFEQSSHMLFHDEPEKFNATIADFLKQSPRQLSVATGDC